MPRRTRALGVALSLAALAAIAALTLRSHPRNVDLVELTPLTCLVCGELGTVDVLMNVLLFVPLGAGLALAGLPWRRVVLVAAVATLTIELLQLTVLVGRDASLSDVLTNTAGGGLGCWLALRRRAWLLPAVPSARRLLAAGWLAWVAVLAGTAWLLRPSLPDDLYYGQWAPDLAHLEPFTGQVLAAAVDDRPLPPGPAEDSPALRRRLQEPQTVVTATAVADRLTWGVAPIVSVFDHHQREIFILGQFYEDLVFRLRTRASDLRLRTPAVRLDDALALPPGDTVRLSAGRTEGQRLFLRRVAPGRPELSFEVALSPTLGWALLLPLHYSLGPEQRYLSAAWSAALVLLLGYWAARAGRLAPLALAALVALALVSVPAAFGLEPLPWTDWAGTAIGAATGLGAGVVSGRWDTGPAG